MLHKPAFLLFSAGLGVQYMRGNKITFIALLFASPFLLIVSIDTLEYLFALYVDSGLKSAGVFFRLSPFVLLMIFLACVGPIRASHLKHYYLVIGLLTWFFIASVFGATTMVDRVVLLLFPTLLSLYALIESFARGLRLLIDSFFAVYWLSFLSVWYFYSETSQPWRLNYPFFLDLILG